MDNKVKSENEGNYPTLILLLLSSAIVALFSIIYPPLNWPDEAYKLSTLNFTDNPYLRAVDWLQGADCGYTYTSRPSITYGMNQFELVIRSGRDCYISIKNANSILICSLIAVCTMFVRKDMRQTYLLSIIWPSSIFYLTSVNNQVVFHVVSMALGVYALYARGYLIPIIITFLCITIDRSFITTLIFFSVLQSYKISKTATLLGFASLFIFNQVFDGVLSDIYNAVTGGVGQSLLDVREQTETFRDAIWFSVALFLISSVYLGGLSSVFGVGIDYIIVSVYFCKRYLEIEKRGELQCYIVSLALAYAIVIQFVPTIQTFRYYVFILPIIIHYILKREHRGYYVVYCVAMILSYLFLAYYVQGG